MKCGAVGGGGKDVAFREGDKCCECTGVDSVDGVDKRVVDDFICESGKVAGEFVSNLS